MKRFTKKSLLKSLEIPTSNPKVRELDPFVGPNLQIFKDFIFWARLFIIGKGSLSYLHNLDNKFLNKKKTAYIYIFLFIN
jgi:hypothetical protein